MSSYNAVVIILLGCGDIPELRGRCEALLKLYGELQSETARHISVVISGSTKEVQYSYQYLKQGRQSSGGIPPLQLVFENSSRNTIENIVNSFKLINDPNSSIYKYLNTQIVEPRQISKIYIVSGNYHLKRIKLIVDTLRPTWLPVEYYGSFEYMSTRIVTELEIEKNISKYIEKIRSYK